MKIRNIKKWIREGMIVFTLFLGIGLYAGGSHAPVEAATAPATDTLPAAKALEFNFKQFPVGEPEEHARVPLLRAAPYPTGYVDSTLYRCFIEMGTVTFSPVQKFWQQNGDGNSNAGRLYGFTVPLIGDLNGDGKPEMVAISLSGGLNSRSEYLYIFNGQTGSVIKQYTLPGDGLTPISSGFHGSPAQIALVDADRNGKAEIIVCFSSSSSGSSSNYYRKMIASFEVVTDSNGAITDLTQKWKSNVRYDAWGSTLMDFSDSNAYDQPIPQIVDINGDGVPELIVYNKIYNAATGAYIMRFGELGGSPSSGDKTANIGSFRVGSHNEASVAFPAIYDIDGDGIYDYIAGGKIYHHINLQAGTYQTLNCTSDYVPDGRTAVADIDGDGKAEIVVHIIAITNGNHIWHTLVGWKPNADMTGGDVVSYTVFHAYCPTSEGYSSFLYIGDVDGKVQNGKKLPEISLICGRPYSSYTSGGTDNNTASRTLGPEPTYYPNGLPVHPNVTDGLLQSTMVLTDSSPQVEGCLISFTWDNTVGLPVAQRLKVSFLLEHQDGSINTGFSLFDFDNDGIMDICYRDERTLRIISARRSYVTVNATTANSPSVIRLSKLCYSYTGFEYPAIADVDNDGSADIVVMGRSNTTVGQTRAFILAVEGANRDLAPAPPVWNQFHYHPMKINADLKTPLGVFHPLDSDYCFYKNASDPEPTFVYNSNIMQAVISSSFETPDGREIIKPVVFTPDAEIIDGAINTTTKKLTFKIRNIGDASLHATTPVRVYLNNESAPSIYNQTLGSALFPGDTRTFEITITDVAGIYDIIVGGTLVNGNLEPGNFPDCDWGNNRETVATFLPREDLATVAHYGTVVIDVFANDILNSPCDNQTLTSTKITTPGGEGVLSGAFGTVYIVNNKIMYTAPGPSYGSNIVKLSYKLTCEGVTRTADIYIYLLESCQGGFTVCRGVSSYEVCLKKEPAEVEFWWYDSDSTYIGNTFPVITNPSSDVTYYVRPHFGDVPSSNLDWYSFRTKSFPLGHITVKVLGTALGADTVRWTGAVDTDWHNPGNWVQVRNGRTLAMTWAPNSNCVDVILGKGCPWYPELNMKTVCRRIHLEDRAMISGIHFLEYESASIDIEPMQKEKDRFVMWSAPLANTYTGDYHFPKAGQSPDWGLVYMNFFQSANPDIPLSVAREKTYTATFGSMGTPLPLGTPFNIYVLPDTEGKRFTFPKSATSYTGANGEPSGALTRNAVGGRFIIDGYLSSSGMLDLPVNAAYSLIQVVNPFPAHLKSADFLAANSASIENSYKIWSGNVDEGFITLLATGDTMRYMITDADVSVETAHWIAPFQSFFVMKRSNAAPFTSLRMTSSMTTTKGFRPGYELRSASSEPGMLRITARQQSYTNTTALYSEAGMSASYDPDEDSRKAFVEGVPVQVYTLTEDREALAINRSGDFSAPVKLGLRLESADTPVTLDFTGVADFGRSVYLIDHEANDREIDLQRSPTYTFAVRPETGGGATEVNARFSLRFGLPSGTETVTRDDVKIYTGQSSIFIDFPVGTITGVAVYNMAGACVYQRHDAMSPVIVPTAPNQLYFIKTFAGNEIYSIHKALVLP